MHSPPLPRPTTTGSRTSYVSSLLTIVIRTEGIERKERTEEVEEEELDNKILKSVTPRCSRALAYKLPKWATNSTTGPAYASTPPGAQVHQYFEPLVPSGH
jgi:hypothetical protein